MSDEQFFQIRDKNGYPVTSTHQTMKEAIEAAAKWIKDYPTSYKVKDTRPWGVVRITVHKIGEVTSLNREIT